MGSWHQIQFDCQNYAKNAIVLLFLAIILHGFDKNIDLMPWARFLTNQTNSFFVCQIHQNIIII